MRACGLAIVEHALDHGFIAWEGGSPQLLLADDAATVRAVRPHWQTVEAVLKRAAAFRTQLTAPGPEPFLRYRDARGARPGPAPRAGARSGSTNCAARFAPSRQRSRWRPRSRQSAWPGGRPDEGRRCTVCRKHLAWPALEFCSAPCSEAWVRRHRAEEPLGSAGQSDGKRSPGPRRSTVQQASHG